MVVGPGEWPNSGHPRPDHHLTALLVSRGTVGHLSKALGVTVPSKVEIGDTSSVPPASIGEFLRDPDGKAFFTLLVTFSGAAFFGPRKPWCRGHLPAS